MIVFAPLIRGGNRPLPLLFLESAGLLVLAGIAWLHVRNEWRTNLSPLLWFGIGILFLFPIVQMIPLPMSWWGMLPGHEVYAAVLEFSGAGASSGARPLSLHARATEYAWLALIPCLAIFFVIQGLDRRQVRQLTLLFVIVSACEAVLGIVQVGAGAGSWLYLGNTHYGGTATGSYVNRNHFAALQAMTLPLALALWAIEILPPLDHRGEAMRHHPRVVDAKMATRIVWSILIVLLLFALLLTRSRAGISCGLLAFAIASLIMVWNVGSRAAKVVLVLVGCAALLLAGYVGLTPILERFGAEELSLDYATRMWIAASTIRAALDFLPLGSGLGTFAEVFPHYQLDRLPGFIDHAHNDYVEAFLELGIAGIAALGLLGLAYVLRWRDFAREGASRSFKFLQIGAGLGMLALIMHGAFDFNFHIPANAIYFSFLAGVFIYEPGPQSNKTG